MGGGTQVSTIINGIRYFKEPQFPDAEIERTYSGK